jgi:beta-1,2-xylosyltransferase
MMSKDLPWRDAHRIRLHKWANNRSMEGVEYIMPDLGQTLVPIPQKAGSRKKVEDNKEEVEEKKEKFQVEMGPNLAFKHEEVKRKTASHFFLDAKLSGGPIQCDEDDGTCDELE